MSLGHRKESLKFLNITRKPQVALQRQRHSRKRKAGRFPTKRPGPGVSTLHPDHTEKTPAAQSPGDIAKAFLEDLDPTGTHHLVAFDPQVGGPDHARTFAPEARGDVVGWVNERDGRFNVYLTVNEVRAGFNGTKAKKTDIVNVRAIYADIDPPGGADLDAARDEIRSRLLGAPSLCKSMIVDSGGGFHVYSVLASKVAATSENID